MANSNIEYKSHTLFSNLSLYERWRRVPSVHQATSWQEPIKKLLQTEHDGQADVLRDKLIWVAALIQIMDEIGGEEPQQHSYDYGPVQ